MTAVSMTPELLVAVQAARAGGQVAANYFRDLANVSSEVKTGEPSFNRVSVADVESERAIVAAIRREFPSHAILAEEAHAADVAADHLWVIDPIDGTNNFLHGIPQFAVSVAYYQAGQPRCGAIFNPARGDWFVAVQGGGAFHWNLAGQELNLEAANVDAEFLSGRLHSAKRLQVSEHNRLDEVLIGLGFYYDRGVLMDATLAAIRELLLEHIHCIRRMGAATLDLCMVATGQLGAYFEYELSPWDFAAGRLIVEEAGGSVTTCDGQPLRLGKTHLLATNDRLHEAMLAITRRHLP